MTTTLSFEQRRKAAIDAPLGREMHRPDTRIITRPGWHQIITPSAPHGMLNEISLSELSGSEAEIEKVIDETVAMYREVKQPTKWYVGPWTRPDDFGDYLARRGFTRWDVRGMGCATDTPLTPPPISSRMPVAGRKGGVDNTVSVEEIDETKLDAYLATTVEAWGMGGDQLDAERTAHLAEMRAVPRTAWFFGARIGGGDIVGTAGLFKRAGYGYLVGGVVLPSARGRGVYRGLVGARLTFLRKRDITYAVTHAREQTAAPILEHLGFETLFRSSCFQLNP